MRLEMTWIRLRHLAVFPICAIACGDSTSPMDAPLGVADALDASTADAAGPDASPDASSPLLGDWRLIAQTIAGMPSSGATLNGGLVLSQSELAFGSLAPLTGILSTFHSSSDGTALVLSDGTLVPITLSSGQLTLELPGQRHVTFARQNSPAPTAAYPLTGKVTLTVGTPGFTAPRVALVFLARSNDETVFVNDIRDDAPLVFNGQTAAFDLSRTRPALGTDRIPFGASAGISVAYVVVYDDRDRSGTLHELFAPCSASTTDCVRGISPIVLTYRDGEAPELTASPYAYLQAGWTAAVVASDQRSTPPRTGLVTTDRGKIPLFDIAVPQDPASIAVLKLDLRVPRP